MTSSRLLVISSCTGDKAVKVPALTLDDFADPDRLAQREQELASVRRPAGAMYTGEHRRSSGGALNAWTPPRLNISNIRLIDGIMQPP